MMTVNLVSVSSGKVLGTMTLVGDVVESSTPSVGKIFKSIKRAYDGASDAEVLQVFSTGWSNGYVKTVPA